MEDYPRTLAEFGSPLQFGAGLPGVICSNCEGRRVFGARAAEMQKLGHCVPGVGNVPVVVAGNGLRWIRSCFRAQDGDASGRPALPSQSAFLSYSAND